MEQRDFALTLTLRSGYEFSVDFGQPQLADLRLDEPAPLGQGHGPNAARLLGAAVGNCLSASLLLCLRKARIDVPELRTTVTGSIVRNECGRLRIGEIRVKLEPGLSPEARGRISRCLELFQDFCIVTESVQQGIPVRVEVEPVVNPVPSLVETEATP